MSAYSRQPRGVTRSLIVRESAFALLLCAVFGTAYASSTFDFRRVESRLAVELQETVAKQVSLAKSSIAEIVEGEERFGNDLFAAVGVTLSDVKDSGKYPPDLTRVLVEHEAALEAWTNIVNCPASSTVVKDAELLIAGAAARGRIQSATEVDRQALAVMLADLSKRLEAVKARAKNLEHVRFMVEAERLELPGHK